MTGSRGAAHRARLAAVSFARESSDAQVRGSRRGTERSAAGSRVRTGISVRSGAMAGFGRRSALARGLLGCRESRSSSSEAFVPVMEAAHFRQRHDLAHAGRVDRSRLRGVLAQGQMSARPMVVGKVGLQVSVQVLLTEDNDVIEALS